MFRLCSARARKTAKDAHHQTRALACPKRNKPGRYQTPVQTNTAAERMETAWRRYGNDMETCRFSVLADVKDWWSSTVVGRTADGGLKRYRNLRWFVLTNG